MPDHKTLRVGDRIRLIGVLEADQHQRILELSEQTEMPGWSADTIERIIKLNTPVIISKIDEFGHRKREFKHQSPYS